MPSRKKDRGKQRKARQSRDVLAGRELASKSADPFDMEKGLMAEGCRVGQRDNGSTGVSHPCFKHVKVKTGQAFIKAIKNFDRGLLSDEERQELAGNYVFSFSQDLREGDYYATDVVRRNIADPHIGRQLEDELLKADIHLSLLHFLNQSAKSSYDALGRVVDGGESTMLAYNWVMILWILMQDGLALDARDGARLVVAKGIDPFLMSVIDDKRELFQSNHVWHLCISAFFEIVRGIVKSKEALLVMISYEGFLPFVAQASCWSQSREDIAAESEILRQVYPDPRTSPEPLSSASHAAQKVLGLAIRVHEHCDVAQEDVMRGALDQIACTPLLSNNPECNDSTAVGFIRMMSNGKSSDRSFLFERIIKPLLLTHGYVDAQVIAELIEYGRSNSSEEAVSTVLKLMVPILGLDEDYDHIQLIDSRYAAAVRHGLLEFCIDALIAHGDTNDGREIAKGVIYLAHTLCASMAMHSKTSRALRVRKEGIMTTLDALRKKSGLWSNEICGRVVAAIDASSCAVCCNCLKEVDRKDLLYCKRCGVECYCSPNCQSESYALGHEKTCKEEVESIDGLREDGLRETELKRMAVLSSNLMMNGCRLVRSMAEECLNEEKQWKEVSIYFVDNPPVVEVSRSDASDSSGSLKFIFTSPMYYGFAEKVGLGEVALEKVISRRSLDNSVGQFA